MAGDINVAFTSGVSLLGAAAQGIDIKMLTSISSRVSWKLMASPQIKKAGDLRGKRFGVQSIVGSTALTESLAFIQVPSNRPTVLKSMMKNLRMTDPVAAENGYQDQLLTLNRKPYPSLEGLRNAQRLMALQNPKIAALKMEDLIDSRFVRKLDEKGFIDELYRADASR
jgi:hypothetical protein